MSSEEMEYDMDDSGEELEMEEGGEEEFEFEEGDDSGDDMDDDDDPNLIENTYYNAKGAIEEDLNDAIELFETIPDMEEPKGKWGFKATKQLIKLFYKTNQKDNMKERYEELFGYSGVVTRNEYEKAINKVLDLVSQNKSSLDLIEVIFKMSLDGFKKEKNEKLWFKSMVRLGVMYLEQNSLDKLRHIIKELKEYCILDDGSYDSKKQQFLLDVLVLEIQLCNAENNTKQIKILYSKCMDILQGAVVLNPRVTGVIRECGGKMHMRERDWKGAANDFFEAFKSYDEEGNLRRVNCLKYLILATMLRSSSINPFEANEVKPYKKHPEIIGMRDLFTHYTEVSMPEFEKTLKKYAKVITGDLFMNDYIPDLLTHMRTKVLTRLLRPYSKVKLSFLARELNISIEKIEELCVSLILDEKINAKIDQIKQLLEITKEDPNSSRFESSLLWAKKLDSIHSGVLSKVT